MSLKIKKIKMTGSVTLNSNNGQLAITLTQKTS